MSAHDELVRPLLVEDLDGIDRVAHVFRVLEADGLDEATFMDEQAGRDAGAAWSGFQLREVAQQRSAPVVALLGVALVCRRCNRAGPRVWRPP